MARAASTFGAMLETGNCIGIGSPRASLESNFALRQLVGPDRFYAGIDDDELSVTLTALDILKTGPASSPSLNEIEQCDAVLVLGEDVTNVLPLMALRLRQSVRQQPIQEASRFKIPLWLDHAVRELAQDEKGPLFIAAPYATKLDEVATAVVHAAPDELARLGFAVARAIDEGAPEVADLSDELATLAGRIAAALNSAQSPLIVSGSSCRSTAVVKAAAQVAWALSKAGKPAKLSFCFPECNSVGLGLMKPRPFSDGFLAARDGKVDTVIVLENDLFRRVANADAAAFLKAAQHAVVLDHLKNPTTASAELVLPAGTFAETDGTLVNNEGRSQRFFQAFVPSGEVLASWRWLGGELASNASGKAGKWQTLDEIVEAIADEMPVFAGIEHAAPSRKEAGKVAREPNRYSGRTSMLANISVHEPKPPEDADSALAFSMESGPQRPPPALTPFFWSPGWNSIQSVNKFQAEVGGPLRGGDPGVRLINPGLSGAWNYFSEIPIASPSQGDGWLFVPCFHIFGSEELSRLAPGISELAPRAFIVLNATEGESMGFKTGEPVKVSIGSSVYHLDVALRPDVPRGVALLPAGLTPIDGTPLPAPGKLTQAAATVHVGTK